MPARRSERQAQNPVTERPYVPAAAGLLGGSNPLASPAVSHSARGELMRRAGKASDARTAFQRALESARLEPWKRFFGGTNQGTDPLASFLRNFVTRVDFVLARSTMEQALGKSVC